MLSGTDLCDGPIPCPEEAYRVCVFVDGGRGHARVRVCVSERDQVQQ